MSLRAALQREAERKQVELERRQAQERKAQERQWQESKAHHEELEGSIQTQIDEYLKSEEFQAFGFSDEVFGSPSLQKQRSFSKV